MILNTQGSFIAKEQPNPNHLNIFVSRVGSVSKFADLASIELIWFDKEFLFLPFQASYVIFSGN